MARGPSLLGKIVLATVSVGFAVGCLELAFRVMGLAVHDWSAEREKVANFQILNAEGDYFQNPPDTTAEFWGSTSSFNSLGMRDVEPPPAADGESCRLLLLGDSVTLGEGVAQPHIFTYRLRDLLAPRGVQVMGAGVSGWNSVEEERFLRLNLDRLDPDVVALTYVVNDYEPYNSIRREREREMTLPDRVLEALVLRSRLVEWAVFTYKKSAGPDLEALRVFARWGELLQASGPPYAPTDPGWLASRDALLRMRDALAARNAKLVVFLHRLGANPLEQIALERLRELSRESGIPVVDTLPFFEGHPWQGIVNNPLIDPHPNAEGHQLIGKGMARALEEGGYLPCAQAAPTP